MTRVISGVVLAAAALAAILFLPIFALRVVACIVAALAAYEYLSVAGIAGAHVNLPVAAAIVVCAVASAQFDAHYEVIVLLVFALVAAGVLFGGWPLSHGATVAFAPIYLGVPLGMLAAIHARFGWPATLLVISTSVVSDTVQFYTGRAFGRRPLAPAISPKKTVEGAIGGLIAGTLFVVFAGPRTLPAWGIGWLLAIGVSVVGLGICGDLFESRLKREAKVKDSSSLIPGHGGILDRIDALLFAVPAWYAYLRFLS
jgi:phosphatidate cytidylyltransferase